jgi:hypothetical protein
VGGGGQQRPTCAVVADGDGVGVDINGHIEPVHGRVVVRRIDHDLVKYLVEARHVGDLAPVHAHALVVDPHSLGVAHLGRTDVGVRPKQDVLQGAQAAVDPLRAPAVGLHPPSNGEPKSTTSRCFLFWLWLSLQNSWGNGSQPQKRRPIPLKFVGFIYVLEREGQHHLLPFPWCSVWLVVGGIPLTPSSSHPRYKVG